MPNAAGKTWQPHVRAQWGGTLGLQDQDIWSNSVAFHSGGVANLGNYIPLRDELVDALPGVYAALTAWFQNTDALISNVAKLSFLKLNVIGENGKQRDSETVGQTGPVVNGAMGNPVHPWQVSWAITLRSDTFTRGRGHSGRIYPPMPTANLEAGYPYCTNPAALTMADAFRDCLVGMAQALTDAVNGPDIVDFRPVIASPGDVNKGTSGFNSNIDRVVVDRVPDIQRRRVNNGARAEGEPSLSVQP